MKTFYHGTSSALSIKRILLPAYDTGILREDFRKKCRNLVFITTSLVSAERYARKAVQRLVENLSSIWSSLIMLVSFKTALNGLQKRLILLMKVRNHDKSRT